MVQITPEKKKRECNNEAGQSHLEGVDPSKWDQEEGDVKKLTGQELTPLVLTLSTNHIYNHAGRPASRTRREIAHSLQYYPRSEMIIGTWSKRMGNLS